MTIRLQTLFVPIVLVTLAGCDNDADSFAGDPVAPGGGGPGGLEAVLVWAPAGGAGSFLYKIAVNGPGTVVVFGSNDDPLGSNPSGDEQIFAIASGAQAPVQISTDTGDGFRAFGDFDIDDSGSQVVFISNQDLTGSNPNNISNVFLATTDGMTVTQVTSLAAGFAGTPRIAGNGSTIIFTSEEDLTGDNPTNDRQIFSIDPDGMNLTQVTMGATFAEDVAISDDGSRIVWQGLGDPLGTNADGSREIFAINADGTNLQQLTMSDGDSFAPRISDDGGKVIFASPAEFAPGSNPDGEREVYVVNGDGTGLTRITDTDQRSGEFLGGAAGAYDISGNGQYVVYTSRADLFGINSDNTHTIYWSTSDGTTTQQQLREETKPDGVASRFADQPVVTNDGSGIFYEALAPYATGAPASGDKIFAHLRQ